MGFHVIPLLPGTKCPACPWDPWLATLSEATIRAHWQRNPTHEVGCITTAEILVLDADSPESVRALSRFAQEHDMVPRLIVNTSKGQHFYYRRPAQVYAKQQSHSTADHPERIDVKTGRSLVVMPGSAGKVVHACVINHVNELDAVTQEFVDDVFAHNGSPTPRQHEVRAAGNAEHVNGTKQFSAATQLLAYIDPNCGYAVWVSVGMALHHESDGSDAGLDAFDSWSAGGKDYPGRREIEVKWRSFKSYAGKPYTIGTLIHLAREAGASIDPMALGDDQFEVTETEVVSGPGEVHAQPSVSAPLVASTAAAMQPVEPGPLARFSLRGKSEELEKQLLEQEQALGPIALTGQATVIFAPPNTGKTLLTLHLLTVSLGDGSLDAGNVYYINMDDTAKGLVEKLKIADTYGFHMLADGHLGFRGSMFLTILNDLVTKSDPKGMVIILDTAKKVADLMSKSQMAEFTQAVRRFVSKGGTLIALAHTNKNRTASGKLVYAGTSDLVDDFDCAYIVDSLPWTGVEPGKVIELKNIKRRGDVPDTLAYRYSTALGKPYSQILASVVEVPSDDLAKSKAEAAEVSDAVVITAIKACIGDGITKKMDLARAAAERARVGRNAAIEVIDRYDGSGQQQLWAYSVGERGAKNYSLISAGPPTP
ncbi:PriCT-2 domain-containing protein [Pelomonas sp. SE-A7]|nr:PriCT-2 domain-containing protein [Pelomonas sp. SE-A7]MDM4766166.1 PriCT-2 domain-containing protein [Pelomonas sp. SE-A7]